MNGYLNKKSPVACIVSGKTLQAAAATLDVVKIQDELAVFAKVQAALETAQTDFEHAEQALRLKKEAVAEFDRELDLTVDAMIGALVQDGHPRRNPLRAFGVRSGDGIRKLKTGPKAIEVGEVARRIAHELGASTRLVEVTTAADQIAGKVATLLGEFEDVNASAKSARGKRRLALATWEKLFVAVGLSARAADRIDGGSLYQDLFRKTPPAPHTHAKKPEPTPVVANNGTATPVNG